MSFVARLLVLLINSLDIISKLSDNKKTLVRPLEVQFFRKLILCIDCATVSDFVYLFVVIWLLLLFAGSYLRRGSRNSEIHLRLNRSLFSRIIQNEHFSANKSYKASSDLLTNFCGHENSTYPAKIFEKMKN